MKIKRITTLSLLTIATVTALASCASDNTPDRWKYTRDDMENFSQVEGLYSDASANTKRIAVDYDIPLLSSSLSKDDFVLFNVDKATEALENSGKTYADYSIISSAKVEALSFETETDLSGFSIDFNGLSSNTYGILINKEIVTTGDFMMVTGVKDSDTNNVGVDSMTQWEESYASDSITWKDDVKFVVQVAANIGSILAGIFSATVNPVAITSGIFGILSSFGDQFCSSGASIADVLQKLKDMDSKIDDISNKISINQAQLIDALAMTQAMIESSLYEQTNTHITTFNHDYLAPIDNYNDNFVDELAKGYKKFITEDQDINLYLSKSDAGDWMSASLVELGSLKPNFTIHVNFGSFNKAQEFLNSNNNIVKNGFADALKEDFVNAIGDQEIPDGLTKEEVAEYGLAMASEMITKEYYSNNSSKASEYRNLVSNYSKSIDGEYDAIMSYYMNRLSFMYNFAGEAKQALLDITANLKLYLDINAARAMMACEFAGIDYTNFESTYLKARSAISGPYEALKAKNDCFCFVTGTVVDGNFYRAKYNTYYTNPGDDCVLHVDFSLQRVYSDERGCIRKEETKFSDHPSLSQLQIAALARRYNNIGGFDGSVSKMDFARYLGSRCPKMADGLFAYDYYRGSRWIGTDCYRIYTGCNVRSLTSNDTSLGMNCEAKGNPDSSYYKVGNWYNYGSNHDFKYWEGQIAETTYLDAATGAFLGTGKIAAWARYAENHWWWVDDEWFSFVDNPAGNYFFILQSY